MVQYLPLRYPKEESQPKDLDLLHDRKGPPKKGGNHREWQLPDNNTEIQEKTLSFAPI